MTQKGAHDEVPAAGLPGGATGPALETAEEIASWDVEGDDIKPWLAETGERGTRVFGSQVSKPANAATVRVREGEVVVSDGPYAETKEWMAGFDVIECADMDRGHRGRCQASGRPVRDDRGPAVPPRHRPPTVIT